MQNVDKIYKQTPSPESLREVLQIQSAMDIIMQDEEDSWLRLVNFYKNYNSGIDVVKFDNGAGDTMCVVFSEDGVIIKGFDHESILSPYDNEEEKIAKGIYDFVPNELMELLKDESMEKDDVTFCIWRSKKDSDWQKGNIDVPEGYEDGDDGEEFLLGYIFENPEEWLEWGKDYYEMDFSIEDIREIYEHKNITKEIVQKINPERDADSAIREINYIGLV